LPLALLINFVANDNDMKEVIYKLGLPISKLQKEIEAEAQNDRLYLPLLFIVETTLANVKIEQESPAAMQLALDNFIGEYGRLNPDTAAGYYNIGKILLIEKDMSLRNMTLTCLYETLDIRLKLYGHNHADTANSYYHIGRAQFQKKDYKSALQSFEQALDISQNLLGKNHPDVFITCNVVGVTKYYLKEYDSALHWQQEALDISVALYGKAHPGSARSYYCIADCQYEMQDYDSALASCQQALDIRLKLFGQESEDTRKSYGQMKFIRSKLKVSGSSPKVD
jgi:tetratricopeptide (TPR) repeat protein